MIEQCNTCRYWRRCKVSLRGGSAIGYCPVHKYMSEEWAGCRRHKPRHESRLLQWLCDWFLFLLLISVAARLLQGGG